jgi:hypothetical protein
MQVSRLNRLTAALCGVDELFVDETAEVRLLLLLALLPRHLFCDSSGLALLAVRRALGFSRCSADAR